MVDINRRTSSDEDIYLRYVIRDVVGDSHSVQFECVVGDVKVRMVVHAFLPWSEGGAQYFLSLPSIPSCIECGPISASRLHFSCWKSLG